MAMEWETIVKSLQSFHPEAALTPALSQRERGQEGQGLGDWVYFFLV
jgi:hypothetical protein